MANDVAGVPWSADETGTLSAQRVLVRSFHFFSSTATDAVVVTDTNDRPVWAAEATAEQPQASTPVGAHINGLKATITGTGGVLYVYV